MLANVAIRAYAAGVLDHQSLLGVLAGDDVDDAGYGIRAVERRRGPLHYLDALDVVRVDEREVVLAAVVAMQAPAVNEYEHVGVAQSVHLQVRPHVVLAEVEAGRQSREDVLYATPCILL